MDIQLAILRLCQKMLSDLGKAIWFPPIEKNACKYTRSRQSQFIGKLTRNSLMTRSSED